MIGEQVGMHFQIGGDCVQGVVRKLVYDTNRLRLCVDGSL